MKKRHTDDQERSWIGLLVDPVFGAFFFGKTLSTAGIWIQNIVGAVLVYELSGSTLAVGAVSVAQFAPQIILAPAFGAAADRGSRKRQLVLGRLISGAGSGALALALALGKDILGTGTVIGASLIVGVGFVIGGPAMLAIIPSLVRPTELASAVALNSVPPSIARAMGPVLGTLIAARFSPAAAFGVASILHFAFAFVVSRLAIVERHALEQRALSGKRDEPGLWRNSHIMMLMFGVGAIGVAADPVITLTPQLSSSFGYGSSLAGTFASSFGVGAAVGLPLFAILRRYWKLDFIGSAGLALMAIGNVLAGFATSWHISGVAFVLAGVGMSLAISALTTQVHESVTENVRGRSMGLWSVAFLGSRPIAAAVNGAIADTAGHQVAFLVVAISAGVASYLVRPRHK